jgi:hypothetical protein
MAGSITMDRSKFKAGVKALEKTYGTTAAGVMRKQMSIFAGQLVKRYPPNTKSVGRTAIENDLKRIMIPMPKENEGTLTRWQDTLESIHDVFDDTGTRIQDWHKNHMDRRTHRVTRSIRTRRFVGGRDFSDKLHVRERDFKKYVNRVAKNVGTLKGGWVAGVNRWAGGAKPPAWVGGKSSNGKAIDRMKDNGSGYLEIRNNVQGSARWKRIDKFVAKSRERGFQKELKYAIKKANTAGNKIK